MIHKPTMVSTATPSHTYDTNFRLIGQRLGRPGAIGELQLGVLNAADAPSRARRADTLALARTADPIPISEAIMVSRARPVADCRVAGPHSTVKLTDALIAATAVEHGLAVVAQDDDTTESQQLTPLCE